MKIPSFLLEKALGVAVIRGWYSSPVLVFVLPTLSLEPDVFCVSLEGLMVRAPAKVQELLRDLRDLNVRVVQRGEGG